MRRPEPAPRAQHPPVRGTLTPCPLAADAAPRGLARSPASPDGSLAATRPAPRVEPQPFQPYEGMPGRELPCPVGAYLLAALQTDAVKDIRPVDVRRQTQRYEGVALVGREDLVHAPQQGLPRGRNSLARHPQ